MPADDSQNDRGSLSPAANHFCAASTLALAAILALVFTFPAANALWLPQVGVGLAASIWLGGRFVMLLAACLHLAGAMQSTFSTGDGWVLLPVASASIVSAAIALAWGLYTHAAKGSAELDDPRSAALFLILVPGVTSASSAFLDIIATGKTLKADAAMWRQLFSEAWIADMLGFLVVTPFAIVNLTPMLRHLRILPAPKLPSLRPPVWTWGESIELAGLAFGNCLLSLIQIHLHLRIGNAAWPLWGISLLLVVWSTIRQGLRGGTITAFAGSAAALVWASELGVSPADLNPLQGNFLAQCSTALLVGSSVAWIRATEARYRHVVGHIPLVLTSIRLSRGIAFEPDGVPLKTSSHSRPDLKEANRLVETAEIILVSRASQAVLGVDGENLLGPYSRWLDAVHADDRDLVVASISQLALQRQTVICEYRVAPRPIPACNGEAESPKPRWVRDTLSPHYTDDGLLDGWDGVVEEITEQRGLQHENRHVTGMLQALVANMPTGVFFVTGPSGRPLLVNARARQLLGQREDAAAGLPHLSQAYRLHRSDGTIYPVDELPVVKALRYGQTCTANDIIVHRPDGRRVPLFTWAAPIDLGTIGRPEGAVWVLEELSALQHAESARRESETRLRAVFETLAEGVIVQNKAGVIIEGNPSAANILEIPVKDLVGRRWLGPDVGCLLEPGVPCPPEEHPDRVALQLTLPVRNVVFGMPRPGGETRWLLVNSMPLPIGTEFLPNTKEAQLVTTFADITAERQAQRGAGNESR